MQQEASHFHGFKPKCMANNADGGLRTVFHQSDTWNLFNHLHSNLMEFDNDLPNQVWKLHHPYSAHPKSCYIYIVNLKRQISTLEMAVDGFSWEISNNGRWSTLSNVVCTRLHRRVTHGGAVFKPLKRP